VTTGATGQRVSRSDATRNRARLVAAAREVFGLDSVDARLDEIARRAGVGIATLYRHFPTRAELVDAIFAERVEEYLVLADAALTGDDAWAGLCRLLEVTLEFQSGDRVLKQIFLGHPPGEGARDAFRGRMRDLLRRAVDAAHAEGTLRADFGPADLTVALWSFWPVVEATDTIAPEAWRRHLHWLLDGLRPRAATPQTTPPLDERQLAAASQRLRLQRFPRRPGPPRRPPPG
jgi:AcrR family transcriptional regulator